MPDHTWGSEGADDTSAASEASDPPPFTIPDIIDPFVRSLESLVGGRTYLDEAVRAAYDEGVIPMHDWKITNAERFLQFVTGMLRWIPTTPDSNGVEKLHYAEHLLYYILAHRPINVHQSPIHPNSISSPMSPVSQWIVTFVGKVGQFMDTPESLPPETLRAFLELPDYNLDEAEWPPGGFQTFNQMFGRRLKPGMRPISDPHDNSKVCWPADSTLVKWEPINSRSEVVSKGLEWPISALLDSSTHGDAFAGGRFMHAYLSPNDYHRFHAPVSGRILEAKVIQGQARFDVRLKPQGANGNRDSVACRSPTRNESEPQAHVAGGSSMESVNEIGYQFLQTRGCIVIENELLGKVAFLPIGMALVSSVRLSVQDVWEGVGARALPSTVVKGDELGCFQFGGSDFVLVFQEKPSVDLSGLEPRHYKVGQPLAEVLPQ